MRNFYRKLGYDLDPSGGEFMIKRLSLWYSLTRHRHAAPVLVLILAVVVGVILRAAMGGGAS